MIIAPARRGPGDLTVEDGYLLGLLVGDGTLKTDKAVLSVWRPASCSQLHRAPPASMASWPRRCARRRRSRIAPTSRAGAQSPAETSIGSTLAALKRLADRVGMTPGAASRSRRQSSAHRATSTAGFLRGLFDTDGSVQGSQAKGVSVRLAQSDLPRLQAVQRMLLRLGIVSSHLHRAEARVFAQPAGWQGRTRRLSDAASA